MSSSGEFVPRWINVGAIWEFYEFILVLLTMLGRLPNPFTSIGVNAVLLGSEVFIHCALLVSWFLSGFRPEYLLFNATVWIRFWIGVRVGGVLHIIHDPLEVNLLEILWSKFIKISFFIWSLLSSLLQDFYCFLKLSVSVLHSATLPLIFFFM